MVADNSDFMKDFLGEWNDPKKSRKSLGTAIGLPDKKDEEFLIQLIKKYEATHPGWLAFAREQGRKNLGEGRHANKDDAMVNKASNMTYDFEFPADFYMKIEAHYPLMFRDIAHYRWFKKFMIAYMIKPNTKRGPKR